MNPDKKKTSELLAFIVVVCTVTAVVVLAIDMQLKKTILELSKQTHEDLLTLRRLVRYEQTSAESRGLDIRTGANAGTDSGSGWHDVSTPHATVEADATVTAPTSISVARGSKRRPNVRAAGNSPQVPSSDK